LKKFSNTFFQSSQYSPRPAQDFLKGSPLGRRVNSVEDLGYGALLTTGSGIPIQDPGMKKSGSGMNIPDIFPTA
jgi:hypothetical protein